MFKLRITLTELRPADVARTAFKAICKRGFAHMARYWFERIFPKHFLPSARGIYGHQPRSKPYIERKKRLAGLGFLKGDGRTDNVFTGRTRDDLLGGAIVSGFPTRGRVKLRGPDYLRMRFVNAAQAKSDWYKKRGGKSQGNQPDKKRELTTLTEREKQELTEVFRKFVMRELRSYRGQPRKTKIS